MGNIPQSPELFSSSVRSEIWVPLSPLSLQFQRFTSLPLSHPRMLMASLSPGVLPGSPGQSVHWEETAVGEGWAQHNWHSSSASCLVLGM